MSIVENVYFRMLKCLYLIHSLKKHTNIFVNNFFLFFFCLLVRGPGREQRGGGWTNADIGWQRGRVVSPL